jgi:hypothetical protein
MEARAHVITHILTPFAAHNLLAGLGFKALPKRVCQKERSRRCREVLRSFLVQSAET